MLVNGVQHFFDFETYTFGTIGGIQQFSNDNKFCEISMPNKANKT